MDETTLEDIWMQVTKQVEHPEQAINIFSMLAKKKAYTIDQIDTYLNSVFPKRAASQILQTGKNIKKKEVERYPDSDIDNYARSTNSSNIL
ncbi:Uncharacterised protein [uncultured archaeon]|nr:Uncharacterised protein [uncultured archaeon]